MKIDGYVCKLLLLSLFCTTIRPTGPRKDRCIGRKEDTPQTARKDHINMQEKGTEGRKQGQSEHQQKAIVR